MKDWQSIQILVVYPEKTSKPVISVKSINILELTVHFFLDLESWSQSINSVAPIPRGQSIWGVGVGVSEILWQFYALTWKQLKLT